MNDAQQFKRTVEEYLANECLAQGSVGLAYGSPEHSHNFSIIINHPQINAINAPSIARIRRRFQHCHNVTFYETHSPPINQTPTSITKQGLKQANITFHTASSSTEA